MRDDAVLFIGLLLFRLIISFIKECLTHPDELWQSVEPAYVLVYGKGRLPYDWAIGMRGYFSIIPYVLGMLMAKFLGNLALAAPANYAEYLLELENVILWNWHKVIAAVLGAIMDMCTIKMARRYFGWSRHYDRWVILFLACNGTWFTYSVRAFSNNLEGVFALTALYMWPASAKGWSSR